MAKRKRNRGGAKGPASAPASAVTLAVTTWDLGAAGSANRHGLIIEPSGEPNPVTGIIENPNNVIRARRVDMLDVWRKKGVISQAGWYAGVKLRDAIEATQKAPGWPDNDRVQSSPKPDHAVTIQIDRLSAVSNITKHIAAGDKDLLWHCTSGGIPATLVVQGVKPYHGRAYEAGLLHLSQGLDRLADAMGWGASPRMGMWRADGA